MTFGATTSAERRAGPRERFARGCDAFGTVAVPRLSRPFAVRTHTDTNTPSLTFDDGPDPEVTPRLLRLLDACGVRAIFFVIGERAARYPSLVAQIAEAGHAVGNHSWTHAPPWRLSRRRQLVEYERTGRLLRRLTGQPSDRVRPPYGMHTPTLDGWAVRRGVVVWMWARMPPDYRSDCPNDRIAADLRRARPGEIVCLHERLRTVELVADYLASLPDGSRSRSSNTPAISTGQTAVASQWTSANIPPSLSGTNLPQLTPSE